MASRLSSASVSALRSSAQTFARSAPLRSASKSPILSRLGRRSYADVAPIKKPVGAFRGGLFGFLLGSFGSGAAIYYYILEEYRVSNELLTEDIYSLQSAVQRIEAYVRSVEEKVQALEKKKQ